MAALVVTLLTLVAVTSSLAQATPRSVPVSIHLAMPDAIRNSTYATHKASFSPAHPGRTARLQVLLDGRWQTVSTRVENTRGKVAFRFRPKKSGPSEQMRVRLSPTSTYATVISPVTLVRIKPLRPSVAVIAHRGDSHAAPENTLPAFAKAIDEGADAVELDVRCTRDGHLVVLHDRTLRRTTNVERVLPSLKNKRVNSLSLAQIKRLDAGSWKARKFTGTRVPELSDVLNLVSSDPDARVQVELKVSKAYPNLCRGYTRARLIRHVAREFDNAGLLGNGRAAITSFNVKLLTSFQRAQPEVAANALYFAQDVPSASGLKKLAAKGIRSVSIQYGANGSVFTATYRSAAARHGIRLTAWTLNDRNKLYRAVVKLKISSVTSDQAVRTIRFLR